MYYNVIILRVYMSVCVSVWIWIYRASIHARICGVWSRLPPNFPSLLFIQFYVCIKFIFYVWFRRFQCFFFFHICALPVLLMPDIHSIEKLKTCVINVCIVYYTRQNIHNICFFPLICLCHHIKCKKDVWHGSNSNFKINDVRQTNEFRQQ